MTAYLAAGWVVPWFDGDRPISLSTFADAESCMYPRGIMPPCECPTRSTLLAPLLASTKSMKVASWRAEAGISPVALLP